MSLEESVREICARLSSNRATERKKNAESLKDFLTRTAVPCMLTENSLKKTGLNWNNLFDNINDYIIKETEKDETPKNFDTVVAPLCQSLLHLCVSGSNKGGVYIKCEKLTEACLNILNDDRLTHVIGDAYLSLLYKYVFPVEHYLGCISPTIWESLLDVCIRACLKNKSQLDDLVKMRLLLYAVKSATSCCQFVVPLRDSLSNLRRCFTKCANDKKVQEFIMEIIITSIKTLSSECLNTVCEFVDNILQMIFKFYEPSMEQRKKSLLFEVLKLTIILHSSSYKSQRPKHLSYDWDDWDKHLKNILEIVCLETNNIQRFRKQNNLSVQCNNFTYVAASVYYQTFSVLESVREEDAGTSSKKPKLSFNKNKSFEDLLQDLKQDQVPWADVVCMYVKHYSKSITRDDCLLLITILTQVIIDNKEMNWSAIEETLCIVIQQTFSTEVVNENYDIILGLWNACVRNIAASNSSQKAIHTIIRLILNLDIFKYKIILPLLLLYFEKGIPVNDHSIQTLSVIVNKFYNKCCYLDVRLKCFTWITSGSINNCDNIVLRDIFLQLVSNQNKLMPEKDMFESKEIYEVINSYCDIFEYKLNPTSDNKIVETNETLEINVEMNTVICNYLDDALSATLINLESNENTIFDFIKVLKITLTYFDLVLKNKLKNIDELTNMRLFFKFQTALKYMDAAVTKALKSDGLVKDKIAILKCIQEILLNEYEPVINIDIRKHMEDDFFHCVHDILKNTSSEDVEMDCEDDLEVNVIGLKQNCVYVLAAYCRKQSIYTDEVIKCILDRDLYNFKLSWDVNCAYKCIEMLNVSSVEQQPIGLMFGLMQNMCKELFRNSQATFKLFQILKTMLPQIWSHEVNTLRQNCIIMIKSYLQRCIKMFYPPHVAVLIFECVAKILELNKKKNLEVDSFFKEILLENIKNNSHNIRLYCCYLLRYISKDFSQNDLQNLADNLKDIFVVNVSEKNRIALKDEMSNRTQTLLYCFYVIGVTRNVLINKIIIKILDLHIEKKMDGYLVQRMLNKLTQTVSSVQLEIYLNNNIMHILRYWFSTNKTLKDIPVSWFGFQSINEFVENHMKILIPCEILWQFNGNVEYSKVLKLVQTHTSKSKEDIIETCFCNIIILCLPHIVTDKYKLENEKAFKFRHLETAKKMLQMTRHILKDDKWNSSFAENLGELLLLSATYTRDYAGASETFNISTLCHDDYTLSKNVFLAILRYFGELIDGNLMQYICEEKPLILLNIIFNLWNRVVTEMVLEFKAVFLYTFIMFVENIPLGFASDALLFNFICSILMHAIQHANKEDVYMYVEGMRIVLLKITNHSRRDVGFLKKSILSQTISVLTIKKEEGFGDVCDGLLDYLTENIMKQHFAESVDVVDYLHLMTDSQREITRNLSYTQFEDKLKAFVLNSSNASQEMIANLCKLLKENRDYVKRLTQELSAKGFSDDCGKSVIHRTISALSGILKTSKNDKVIIETCNCISEISSYDLKTLVTVPPLETNRIVNVQPTQYFAISVLSTLSNYLIDGDPNVSNKAAKAINQLLKFRDGKTALDMECDNKQMIQALSSDCDVYAEYNVDNDKFNLYKSSVDLIPNKGENHSQWISRITLSLFDIIVNSKNFISNLRNVCVIQPSVCEKILPPLVGLLLDCFSEDHTKAFSQQINQAFKYIWDTSFQVSFDSSENSSGSTHLQIIDEEHKKIIQYLLDIVNFVRIQRNQYSARSRTQSLWLNYLKLDYDKVAWAATVGERHLAGVYYSELWASAANGDVPPAAPHLTTALPAGDHVQTILRRCYVSIGEMDAIDGCGTAHLTSENEKRKHLISCGQYTDALLLHDISLSRGNVDRDLQYGAVMSLHKSGMHHLALQYIRSYPENEDLNDVKYECLSYLGDWNDFVDTRELEEKSRKRLAHSKYIIKAMRYACLKDCLTIEPITDIDDKLRKPLNRAKLVTARLCRNLNMENCQNVYKIVANLHLFRDIENYFNVRCGRTSISELINVWNVDMLPTFTDFKHLETLISQRSLILEHARTNYSPQINDITELQLKYAELALTNQRIQIAERLVAALKSSQTLEKVTLLESQISWAKGHKDIALSLLNGIVAKQSDDTNWTAMSLRQYGLWMAECKRENGRDIINKYLEKSMTLLNNNGAVDSRLNVYYDIAKFADEEYKQVVAYMSSSAFENKLKCIEDIKGTAASLRSSQQSLTRDERRALSTSNAFRELDQAEINNLMAEKENFLDLAMRYYLLSLAQSDENNLSIFRVISLWFDNPTLELDSEGSNKLEQLFNTIPSWKFITVLPQVAPRLSNESNRFSDQLRKIILKCALEHPHHTLPILFNLKNSEKDKCILNAANALGSRGGGASSRGGGGDERGAAAAALLSRLAAPAAPLAPVLTQMDRLCDAIISFAYCVPQTKVQSQTIPKAEPIAKLRNLDHIPIPTDTIAVRKGCDYSKISTLASFDNYFELVGGINFPKKISCLGSDGKKRILLVKGEDDLRQDAVMQQVFNIVNTLLEKNPITYRNKLLIRTYKVVAMSRRSGVLEWCEGTMPLGVYLIAAHARYRPQDISASAARAKLKECHDNRRSNKHKLDVFNEILKVFKPVFHHFFTEHYLDPVTWYERRLAYTRSVATSSMVGYIMGIGDRHVQNILIDKTTAEVVHIDFGIAFDQGQTLPTPETVPFRLTQDIIAGFGCSGVEGIFRRCCEKSLQLLRDNQETLLTILEVLLYDPLYMWQISATPKSSRCKSEGASGLAERALLAVRSKMAGGAGAGVSAPGHVATLLRAAAAPHNLCRLFPGWQPYL